MSPASLRPALTGASRATEARARRIKAADLSQSSIRPAFEASDNGDNAMFALRPMAFTKGLKHDTFGMLLNTADYTTFETKLTQPGPNNLIIDPAFDVPCAKNDPTTSYDTQLGGSPADLGKPAVRPFLCGGGARSGLHRPSPGAGSW